MKVILKRKCQTVFLGDNFYEDLLTIRRKFDNIFQENLKVVLITGQKSFRDSPYYEYLNLALLTNREPFRNITVRPNPTEKQIELYNDLKGIKDVLIIAVGGGSVIDFGKLLKFKCLYEARLFAIYTKPGSATIVTPFAVFDDPKFKIGIHSESLIPKLVYINKKQIAGLDNSIKIAAMCDILCHALESLLSMSSTESSGKHALSSLGLLINNPSAADTDDLVSSDILAGLSESVAAILFPHAAGHYLTYYYKVPHSVASIGFLLPYIELLSEKGVRVDPKYLSLARRLSSVTAPYRAKYLDELRKNSDEIISISKKFMPFAYEGSPVKISDTEYKMIIARAK